MGLTPVQTYTKAKLTGCDHFPVGCLVTSPFLGRLPHQTQGGILEAAAVLSSF